MSNNLLLTRKSFAADTFLCKEGEPFSDIFFLLKGCVEIISRKKVISVVDKEGSFIGELSPLFHQSRQTTLRAVVESECLSIPCQILEELLRQNPERGVNLLSVIAEKMLGDMPEINSFKKELALGQDIAPPNLTNYKSVFLVAKNSFFLDALNFHLNPIKFHVTHKDDPAALIGEIENFDVDMIVFNAVDFPRLWKPLLRRLRELKTYDECVFILITDSAFPFEEAAKAAHLQANGIIPQNLMDKTAINQLFELLKRYKNIDEKRKFTRLVPKQYEEYKLLFTHPVHRNLIAGIITDISLEGASFSPVNANLTKDLAINQEIPRCSLKLGKNIITVDCRVARNSEEIGLEFIALDTKEHHLLFQYLIESTNRELQSKKIER